MRLSCKFKTDKIPESYNMMFVSLIKHALEKSDFDYYRKIYEYGDAKNKKSKNFTFSVFLNGFTRVEGSIVISDSLTLNVSSPDMEFMIKLYNGLTQLSNYKYKEYEIKMISIAQLKEKNTKSNQVLIKTMSPICIKDKNNKYIGIDESDYEKELNYIADLILKNYRGKGLSQKMSINSVRGKVKKVIVKQEIESFTEATNKKYMYILGYEGMFVMSGGQEDINDLYKLGVGHKRNQGFGMFNLY